VRMVLSRERVAEAFRDEEEEAASADVPLG
jgi:hypothetical protein